MFSFDAFSVTHLVSQSQVRPSVNIIKNNIINIIKSRIKLCTENIVEFRIHVLILFYKNCSYLKCRLCTLNNYVCILQTFFLFPVCLSFWLYFVCLFVNILIYQLIRFYEQFVLVEIRLRLMKIVNMHCFFS